MLDIRPEDILRTYLINLIHHIGRFNNHIGVFLSFVLFILFVNYKSIQHYLYHYCIPLWEHFHIKSLIELNGSIIEDVYGGSHRNYSKRFVSILHYIHTHDCKVQKMLEICINDLDQILDKNEKQYDELLINQFEPVLIAKDIYCRFSVYYDDRRSEKIKSKVTNVESKLYSYKKTTKELQAFIDECIKEYDMFLEDKMNSSMYYFVYDRTNDEDSKDGFKKIKFQSSKTFDNIFFKDKTALIKRIDYFQNNKDQYDKLGIPYTFGVLMHGEPGTGKTSAIKAIANYTKRHIIAIPLYKIKDINVLMKLFLNIDIDGVTVPFEKRIYVLEEIDCNGLKDVVTQRKKQSQEKKTIDSFSKKFQERIMKEFSEEQLENLFSVVNVPNKNEVNHKITLGSILELLDGLIETPGRILIITTNHPDELDHALIRPGRIDMNIHFSKASKDDVTNMYTAWYSKSLPKNVLENMEDNKFTHAELHQIFFNNIDNPQKTIDHLYCVSTKT